MTIQDFITDWFCRVDDHMKNVPNLLSNNVSEPVSLALFGKGRLLMVIGSLGRNSGSAA